MDTMPCIARTYVRKWKVVGVSSIPYLGPLGPLRARHGADALLDCQRDLATQIDGTLPAEHLAHILASHVLDADDEHCRDELGLIVAADRIQRTDLAVLLGSTPPETRCGHMAPAPQCRNCSRSLAWKRIRNGTGG